MWAKTSPGITRRVLAIVAPVGKVWAGIVRVSFVGTRAGDRFHADEDQVADIERAIAGMRGATVEMLPPELDVSGGLPLEQRPSLLRAVEGVERGDYAGIIVSYLSRLGRNTREILKAWDRVEAAGGRIVVVREGIDTSTPHGRLQRLMLLGIAEHERELHADRFDERRRLATEAGIWQRRQTPLGYSRDQQTRRLVPDNDARRVERAFRDRAAGTAVVTIADRLGMTPSGARQLLRNRVYLGELRVGEYVNPDAHPPIVTVESFDRAQIGTPRPARAMGRAPALLAGIVRCASCGHVMSRGRTARVVYTCHGRSSAGRCPAPAAVTAELLDRHVEAIVLHEIARLSVQAGEGEGHLAQAREAVAVAERELAAYLAAVSAADVGAEAFAEGARDRRARLDEAEVELRRRVAVRPVLGDLQDGLAAWEAVDGHGRNALLRALLEMVVVRRAGGRGGRVPLEDRVRVLPRGAGWVAPSKNSSDAVGVVRLPFPDGDDERVLRMPGGEDGLEGAGAGE
jgi:DNA invertase Pin-like site-specific DNA recombinase